MKVTFLQIAVATLALSPLLLPAGTAVGRHAPQPPDAGFAVGEQFPDIPLPTLDGSELRSVSDFEGDKIILHVFASW